MKLSQALKLKNRLIGEINQLKAILVRENSRRSDNVSKVDCKNVMVNLGEKTEELGKLKTAIATANVPIYSKIERIAELKGQITFFSGLPCREGEERITPYGASVSEVYTHTAFLNQEAIDGMVSKIQVEINKLQDEIDAFNATTEI